VLQRAEESEAEGETVEDSGAAALRERFRFLRTRRIDVSSTEIRHRVRAGRSIRGFVPDAVAEFIAGERLYC
jgi:nicotinate-nucleotide adenylyltransferase